MSRILLLTLALSVAIAVARHDYHERSHKKHHSRESDEDRYSKGYGGYIESPFRRKRQVDNDIDPFVGVEEGREHNHEREGGHHHDENDDSDSNGDDDDDSDEFDRRPHFLPPPPPPPFNGPILVQNPSMNPTIVPMPNPSVVPIPNPSMVPMEPVPIPPPQPIILPIAAEEGDGGIIIDSLPQSLPEPEAQSGDFRRPSGPFPPITTTPPPPPPPLPSTRPSLTPSSTLTCSSVRCPSGSICRMENNRRSRLDEPVCVFIGSNSPSSCSQVRCSTGFNCEMQQSSSCSRLPCPLNPVCVQTPVSPPPPIVSCDSVRCSAGTACRIQAVDHCTMAPCSMQAVCISPCASISCPSNSQCRVDENNLTASCIPNVPSHSSPSCSGVRCGFGERCALVKNCHWSRECREEPKCVRF